jgi:hypothetical protein
MDAEHFPSKLPKSKQLFSSNLWGIQSPPTNSIWRTMPDKCSKSCRLQRSAHRRLRVWHFVVDSRRRHQGPPSHKSFYSLLHLQGYMHMLFALPFSATASAVTNGVLTWGLEIFGAPVSAIIKAYRLICKEVKRNQVCISMCNLHAYYFIDIVRLLQMRCAPRSSQSLSPEYTHSASMISNMVRVAGKHFVLWVDRAGKVMVMLCHEYGGARYYWHHVNHV